VREGLRGLMAGSKDGSEGSYGLLRSTSGFNFDAGRPLGTLVCVIVQNYSQIGQSAAI